tara:strand:+ start:992 stop:1135 length:144 start_codon:yes stop_codon:yes gene_type:complete
MKYINEFIETHDFAEALDLMTTVIAGIVVAGFVLGLAPAIMYMAWYT